jgi:hypothetical protein
MYGKSSHRAKFLRGSSTSTGGPVERTIRNFMDIHGLSMQSNNDVR